MELKDIISISGKPGLFEAITSSKNALIVKSLIDGKKFPTSINQNISSLNEISIFTYEEDFPLRQIFKTISEKENGKETISSKESSKVLTSYFRDILPNYDEERVYTSNIKKILQWYNILLSSNFNFSSIKEEEENKEE